MKKHLINISLILITINLHAQGKYGGGVGSGYTSQTISGIVLPVELLSFMAKQMTNNQVLLEWTSLSTHQFDYFSAEKSRNGVDWHSIGVVLGETNSIELLNYQLVDSAPYIGTNYYRLKQVDVNEEYEYSTIISIVLEQERIQIFPNPTSGTLFIDCENPYQPLQLLDIRGRAILRMETVPSFLRLEALAVGIYYLKIGIVVEEIVVE